MLTECFTATNAGMRASTHAHLRMAGEHINAHNIYAFKPVGRARHHTIYDTRNISPLIVCTNAQSVFWCLTNKERKTTKLDKAQHSPTVTEPDDTDTALHMSQSGKK